MRKQVENLLIKPPCCPCSLNPETNEGQAAIGLRYELLQLPKMKGLSDYVQGLRDPKPKDFQTPVWEVPDFDPLDGGLDAKILFLLEKPGPLAAGSGIYLTGQRR